MTKNLDTTPTRWITAALTAAVALSLAACATPANEQVSDPATSSDGGATTTTLTGTLNAGGASSQTAAQEAWRAGFQALHPDVTVNYDPVGSGGGRENFQMGGIAFTGTDAAFALEDMGGEFAACATGSGLVEVPAYISPIAVGFNLPDIDSLNLDATTLAKIFAGTITTWNDPAIADQNLDLTLPDMAITPVHRSDKSGTTLNFVDYLSKVTPEAWPYEPAEEWPTDLSGEAAEKTQGVRSTVTSTEGAIGYLDASQATDMGTVAVKVGENYVSYSPEAAAAAVGASGMETGREATDVVVALDRTVEVEGVYPIVLVSYLAACETYADSATGELVREYLTYIVSEEGQQAGAANAGSAPLSGDAELWGLAVAAVAVIK